MPETVVQVAYVNPPKGNARSASIKDTAGAYFGINPEWQSQFSPGSTYKLEYTQNGQYRNVTRFKLVSAGAPPTAGSKGHAQDDGLAERIFVCGAINAMLGNPGTDPKSITTAEIAEMVQVCRAAWDITFGESQRQKSTSQSSKPAAKDDMGGDAIPW